MGRSLAIVAAAVVVILLGAGVWFYQDRRLPPVSTGRADVDENRWLDLRATRSRA